MDEPSSKVNLERILSVADNLYHRLETMVSVPNIQRIVGIMSAAGSEKGLMQDAHRSNNEWVETVSSSNLLRLKNKYKDSESVNI